MMNSPLLLVVSSLGIAQGFFWSLVFLSSKERSYRQIVLGLLLMAFSVRMLKSVLFVYDVDSPLWFINIGFAVHLFIGPLLLAYTRAQSSFVKWTNWLMHLSPGILVVIFSTQLSLNDFWYRGGYTALLIQSLVYLLWSILAVRAKRNTQTTINVRWNLLLVVGVGTVLLVYFSNYILRLIDYSWGPVSFSLVIYGWSYFLVRHYREIHHTTVPSTKYKNLEKVSDQRIAEVKEKLAKHFETSSTYLDAEYSLSKLSDEIKVSKHLISKVLNTEMDLSFNDYINGYRISKAKGLLEDSPYLTIASIAFDSGFNSLSTFNQAFKKVQGTTPSTYREAAKSVEV
ncbi:MAG: helix-turn-helix transcriptional regulator [Cyclobacteriaceae bacterium]